MTLSNYQGKWTFRIRCGRAICAYDGAALPLQRDEAPQFWLHYLIKRDLNNSRSRLGYEFVSDHDGRTVNDHFFPPALGHAMFDAYKAGSKAPITFVDLPDFGTDGHQTFSQADPSVWAEPVGTFFEDGSEVTTSILEFN